jgi:hypothetical protein
VWVRKVSIGLAVALVCTASTGTARAQAAPPSPAFPPAPTEAVGRTFPVELEGSRPGLTIRLIGPTVDLPCGERCALTLPKGRYRVEVTAPDGRASFQYLFIRKPSKITVTPRNHTARVAGFVLMPVGLAGIGVGGVILFYGFWRSVTTSFAGCNGCDEGSTLPSWVWPGGAIIAGAGMVIGVTGLVVWQTNRYAGVDVTPLEAPQASRTRLRLTPAAGPRWMGLALTGSF